MGCVQAYFCTDKDVTCLYSALQNDRLPLVCEIIDVAAGPHNNLSYAMPRAAALLADAAPAPPTASTQGAAEAAGSGRQQSTAQAAPSNNLGKQRETELHRHIRQLMGQNLIRAADGTFFLKTDFLPDFGEL